jgi:hypothetical protein
LLEDEIERQQGFTRLIALVLDSVSVSFVKIHEQTWSSSVIEVHGTRRGSLIPENDKNSDHPALYHARTPWKPKKIEKLKKKTTSRRNVEV